MGRLPGIVTLILLLQLAGIFSDLKGQSFNFRSIRREQGLPGGEIYKIIQDRKGYIWGVTDGGVFRYNGSSFQQFTERDGLPGLTFYGLFEDARGRVWVSCSNGSVGYFTDTTYHSISADSTIRKMLIYGQSIVTDIYVDAGDTLWLGTTIRLLRVSPDHHYAKAEAIRPKGNKNTQILKSIGTEAIIGSSSYFDKPQPLEFDHSKNYIRTKILIDDPRYQAILPISWKSDFGTICNLSVVKRNDQTLLFSYGNILYAVNEGHYTDSVVFENRILRIVEDRNGDVWVCLDKNGIALLRKGNFDATPTRFLQSASVTHVLVDQEGGLWVSTLDQGLYFSPSLEIHFYGHQPGLDKRILAMAKIDSKLMVINESGEGILVDTNGNGRKVFHIRDKISLGFYKIKPYHQRYMAVGLITGMLDEHFRLNHYFYHEQAPLYLQDILWINEDSTCALSHSHIYHFKGKTLIRREQLPGRGTCFIADKGSLLIGTLQGLIRYENGTFRKEPFIEKPSDIRINYLYHDSKNRLWVCTKGHGIFYRENDQWKSISQSDGLVSNLCNSLIEARPDLYYVATGSGLSRLTKQGDRWRCTNYDASHGLSGNEINVLTTDGSWLWVGTSTGLNRIPLTGLSENMTPPPVYLQQIAVNNGPPFTYTEGMTFSHSENNISLLVDILTYKQQKGVRLQYMLSSEGFTLNRTIEGNTFELQNIPPGKYQLTVKGINNFGNGSVSPLLLRFSILPPFWKTWWFIVLSVIVAGTGTGLLFRWRLTRQIRQQRQESEIERKLAAYRLEALRAQMNPHFVFNAINGIQRKILQQDPHEAYTYLTRFSQLIRLFLTSTNQQYISLSKELESLRLYVEFEQLRFENSFDFRLEVDPQLEVDDPQIPSMIIQPFVENAIWHGIMPLPASRKGEVNVTIRQKDEQLQIIIRDNGIGIKKSKQISSKNNHASLGMTLTGKRIELLTEGKGSVQTSTPTDGTDGTIITIIL